MTTAVLGPLLGPVNGSNRIFETPSSYRPGSVRVFVNGQLKTQLREDGWEELGGRKIRLRIAPQAGPGSADVLSVFYLPL